MKIEIIKEVGENCITMDDGQKIYAMIHPELLKGNQVVLDFANVKIFASPFFNAAIGQLLKDIKPEALNSFLFISSLSPVGADVLKRVIENSKAYYGNSNLKKAQDEILKQQAEQN